VRFAVRDTVDGNGTRSRPTFATQKETRRSGFLMMVR
jgi:hypothetical protein